MKTRITNLLTATLWLLIVAVWIPTFWVLLKLPGTWDGSNASALAEFTDDGLETVYYRIREPYSPNPSTTGYTNDSVTDDYSDLFSPLFEEPKVLTTRIGDYFIPLILFTLLVLAGQYLLSGKVALSFTNEQGAEEDE